MLSGAEASSTLQTTSTSLVFPVETPEDSSPTYTFKPESAPNLDAKTVAAAAFAAGSVSYLCGSQELSIIHNNIQVFLQTNRSDIFCPIRCLLSGKI